MTATVAPAPSRQDTEILRALARRVDPADPGAQNNLGVLYYRRGMFDDAIAAFSRALALDERMRVARRNLEIAYGESGLLERRVADLEQRLADNPDDIGVLVESGIAEKTAGHLDEAAVLRVGHAFEGASDFRLTHPAISASLPGQA